ncbi:MAG: patatin-like phospholipase family protein [Gemmatimonadota bacterium]
MKQSNGARKLALVLGGGGSKGALQVGLYRALCELGLRPDLIIGASVGAVNGAFMAAGVGPRALAGGWATLSRQDLFSYNWRVLWKGLSASSLFSPARLRRLLERLPARDFEDLTTPLAVVTTHLTAGEPCIWERGDLVEAVVASCSVPGLLPPVEGHDRVLHVDGSLANNVPIEVAFARGATHVVAMNCRTCDRCRRNSARLTDVIGQAFSIAADCKLREMADSYATRREVLLLQPDLGVHINALDFSQGRKLVQAGYACALPELRRWVAAAGLLSGEAA